MRPEKKLQRAWLLLAASIGVHVADEAWHGFLPIWNATVAAVHEHAAWVPIPSFSFPVWLGGLICGVALMVAVTPRVTPGTRWMLRAAWLIGIIMIANALGHFAGTAFGQTVDGVRFPRPMPGFYSSPLLLAAAAYLLRQLHQAQLLSRSGL